MKIVPVSRESINIRGEKQAELLEILMSFNTTDYECVELVDYPQKDATNCVNSIREAMKRYRIGGIRVSRRGEKVYLIKKDISKD